MTQIKTLGPQGVKVCLVGNKADLVAEREITFEQGE